MHIVQHSVCDTSILATLTPSNEILETGLRVHVYRYKYYKVHHADTSKILNSLLNLVLLI